jgi:hypothetical protein
MTRKNPTVRPQGQAFIEAARALGCDESEERFNEALAKVARHKTLPKAPKETESPTAHVLAESRKNPKIY